MVAQHHLWTLDNKLTGFANRHIRETILQADYFGVHVRERQADGAQAIFPAQGITVCGSGCFG